MYRFMKDVDSIKDFVSEYTPNKVSLTFDLQHCEFTVAAEADPATSLAYSPLRTACSFTYGIKFVLLLISIVNIRTQFMFLL